MATIADLRTAKTGFNDVADLLGVATSFTAGTLTPSGGTVTGGTKLGYYYVVGNLCYFEIDILGYTQNTTTSTTYTIPLPFTGAGKDRRAFSAIDRSSSILLLANTEASNTTITIRKSAGATWAIAGAVNIVISGVFITA